MAYGPAWWNRFGAKVLQTVRKRNAKKLKSIAFPGVKIIEVKLQQNGAFMLFSTGIQVAVESILQNRYGYDFSRGLLDFQSVHCPVQVR